MNTTSPSAFQVIAPGSKLYTDLEKTLHINLSSLRMRFPGLFSQLEAIAENEFVLFCDNDGRFGLSGDETCLEQKDLLTDFESIGERQKQFAFFPQLYSQIIIFGAGIGEYLLTLADSLSNGTFKNSQIPKVILVEPEYPVLKAVFSFIDLHDLLVHPSFEIISGPQWQPTLDDVLRTDFDYSQNTVVVDSSSKNTFVSLQSYLRKKHFRAADYWDGRVLVPIQEKEEGSKTTVKKDYSNSGFITEKHSELYQKNIRLLKEYPFFIRDQNFLVELESTEIEIVSPKMDEYGILYNGEYLRLSNTKDFNKNTIRQYKDPSTWSNTYLLVGSGDGVMLRELLDLTKMFTRWESFRQVVYLVELHPIILKCTLFMLDLEEALQEQRLRIFAGQGAVELLEEHFVDNQQSRTPNTYVVNEYYRKATILPKIVEAFKKKQKNDLAESQQIITELQIYYKELDKSVLKEHFSPEYPTKVLCITSRMSSFVQYCTRDLAEGFRTIGCQCERLIEADGVSGLTELEVVRRIRAIKPDLIFILDHLRDEYKFVPKLVPYFCWVQDPLPNIFGDSHFSINKYELVASISSKWIDELKDKPKFHNVPIEFIPLGVNEKVYKPTEVSKKAYDVTYISHMFDPSSTLIPFVQGKSNVIYSKQELSIIKEHEHISKSMVVEVYKVLGNIILEMDLKQLAPLAFTNSLKLFLHKHFKEQGYKQLSPLYEYLLIFQSRLENSITSQIKYLVINCLKRQGVNVAVWGDNWEKYESLADIANGPAKNGMEVNEIQNNSKISLNNSPHLSLHMKAMEIMASNNFMLSRRIPNDLEPIDKHFTESEEVVLFEDEDDLLQKIDFYLEHQDLREEISRRAYEKVIQNYTYSAIARKVKTSFYNRLI